MPFSSVIFDFDGVITNTEPVHLSAWQDVLKREGIKISNHEFKQYIGMNDQDFLTMIGKQYGRSFSKMERHEFIKRKTKQCLIQLKKNIPLIPGITELVEALSKNKPLGICTGACREEINYILDQLKWKGFFTHITTGEDVNAGKPHPQGYIMTFTKLREKNPSLTPERCLVIEDSPRGISAAKAAGLKCLSLESTHAKDELGDADWHAESYDKLPDDLVELLEL